MVAPVLFFFAALTVRGDQTPLHSGCEAGDGVIASLPAGTPVQVRFRLSDGSDCFKISATVDGQEVLGYVPGSALTGLDSYEHERASAASVETLRSLEPALAETKQAVARTGDPVLDRGSQLLAS